MVRDLFIDTTNNCILLIYEEDNIIIDTYFENNLTKVSDIVNQKIDDLLEKNKTRLRDINNFFVVKGPGTFTGVKVGITVAKTCKMLNNNIRIFLISSLQLMSGIKATMAVLDARSNKSYVGVYIDGKPYFPDQVLDNNMLEDFYSNCKNILKNIKYVKNYDSILLVENFKSIKHLLNEIENIDLLVPLYIKQYT
ncbi:tRNA (adenosine(37)-N6)-threonylcarbamoyltransferase complex dimerization subunit type 1 TsaB [Spiroplasma endosymbiont of Aspidapion aeneum]|uniref:tRNA (adenosine(37)-N6)-threonylcarbamoyltransferase complex dimerization subunit type 1 TsaB n=1 Tax=Spiroplasma endosymbiont of Aspidapion aeneum TaxID=3066276 RepID=UPI00313C3507